MIQSGVCLELTGVSSAKWGFTGPNLDIVSWAWFQNIRRQIFLVSYESDGKASSQQVMGKHSVRERPFVSSRDGRVVATLAGDEIIIFETEDGKSFTESRVSPFDLGSWGAILSLTIERVKNQSLMIGIFQDSGHGLGSKKTISALSNEGGDWMIIQTSELDQVSATEDTNFPPIIGFIDPNYLMIVRSGFSVQYWDIKNDEITPGISVEADSSSPTYLRNLKIFKTVDPPSDFCFGIEWGRSDPYYMIIDATTGDIIEENQSKKPSPSAMKAMWKHQTSDTAVVAQDKESVRALDESNLSTILSTIEDENRHPCLAHNRLWAFIPSSIPDPPFVVAEWDLVSVEY